MEHSKEGFYTLVYDFVATIPEGKVITYGEIARRIGKPGCARTVGYAMAAVPEGRDIPSHRVVGVSGKLAPEYAFGSREYQRFLLEKEGVTFTAGGFVRMEKHLWQ